MVGYFYTPVEIVGRCLEDADLRRKRIVIGMWSKV